MSGSMHDDIPEKPHDFFGPGYGCLALAFIAAATFGVGIWGLWELAHAVARWWLG